MEDNLFDSLYNLEWFTISVSNLNLDSNNEDDDSTIYLYKGIDHTYIYK